MKKNLLILVAVIITLVAIFVIPKNGSLKSFLQAGGGLNLSELNQKDTTQANMNVELQFNQTSNQNLEQALVIANIFHRQNGFFAGAGVVGGVSTEFGVFCPTMYFNGGLDFTNFQLEYKVGDFKRSTISTGKVDTQYSNFCTVLGEGGSVKNAMQLSFVKEGTKIGFGHQSVRSFYSFDGTWYAYAEQLICRGLTVSGGCDFGNVITGYAAAKLCSNNNIMTATANKLGTEEQNLILTYSRDNISVWGKMIVITASAWSQANQKGVHLVTGIKQGNKAMLFAELGSNFVSNQVKPYYGLGATYSF